MTSFKLAGREWHWPKFTTRVLCRLRDEFKLDLREILREKTKEVALALGDDEVLTAAFKGLCGDQIAAVGLTDDELADAWDGDANAAVRESLVEAFFTFSQGPVKAKAVMERMLAAGL